MYANSIIDVTGKWRYFGRGGKTDPFEIYRVPENGRPIGEQDRSKYPQRLRREGNWKHDPSEDNILWYEKLAGDFSWTEDEISEANVMRFFEQWSKTKWPGRD